MADKLGTITILYFAKLSEDLGCAKEIVELDSTTTLHALIESISLRGVPWNKISAPEIRYALNQSITNENPKLKHGDEVAFFPPVTGG